MGWKNFTGVIFESIVLCTTDSRSCSGNSRRGGARITHRVEIATSAAVTTLMILQPVTGDGFTLSLSVCSATRA